MQRRFMQVDVFSTVPYLGNPVAVILDGDSLTTEQMQAIARWTNLSETTFVCAPTDPRADYRLRIFCPASEMRFAGHPTIGSAHALLSAGFSGRQAGMLVQECGAGLVRLRVSPQEIHVALPAARMSEVDAAARGALERALGTTLQDAPVQVDLGVTWLTGEVASADLLLGLQPDMAALADLSRRCGANGVTIYGMDGDMVEVRSFAPHEGTPEDPVCGSGNGAVAYLLRRQRGPLDYQARQGRCLGRDGKITISYESDTVWLGGQAVNCIEGCIAA